MKRLSVIVIALVGLVLSAWPVEGVSQQLTREEFRARQQAFLTEKAGLTVEEAAKFFPLYFELQDRKKELNDQAWKLMRQGKDEQTTESQYGEILDGVYDARVSISELERSYIKKFRKILSNKKIYLIQRAEMRFHRELLKGIHGKKGKDEKGKRKSPAR